MTVGAQEFHLPNSILQDTIRTMLVKTRKTVVLPFTCGTTTSNAAVTRICLKFPKVNLHTYHYAGNNPVKLVDPDGESPHIAVFAALGAVTGGAVAAVVSIQSGSSIKDTFINIGVGAAGGLTAGLSLSVGNSALAGAAIGAVSNIIVQRTTGTGEISAGQVFIAAGIGAAGGALGAASGDLVSASFSSLGADKAVAVGFGMLANTLVTTTTAGVSGGVTALMDMNKTKP
jgi:hypothetical protein